LPNVSESYVRKEKLRIESSSAVVTQNLIHVTFESLNTSTDEFNVHGSVHRNNILMYIQQDAMLNSLFISGNCSTRFGWYHHQSSGAQTTVSTASGICHTVITICRYRGRDGTGLSVLWVAHA
jgi:hypothetical protein